MWLSKRRDIGRIEVLFRRRFAWYQNCAIHTNKLLNIECYSVLWNVNSLVHRNYTWYHRKIPKVSYELPLNNSCYFENATAFTCDVLMYHAKATKRCRIIISSTKNSIRSSIKVYQSDQCPVRCVRHSANEGIKQTYHVAVHQWINLSYWLAFFVSMGSKGCQKTDVNFCDRLRT